MSNRFKHTKRYQKKVDKIIAEVIKEREVGQNDGERTTNHIVDTEA